MHDSAKYQIIQNEHISYASMYLRLYGNSLDSCIFDTFWACIRYKYVCAVGHGRRIMSFPWSAFVQRLIVRANTVPNSFILSNSIFTFVRCICLNTIQNVLIDTHNFLLCWQHTLLPVKKLLPVKNATGEDAFPYKFTSGIFECR